MARFLAFLESAAAGIAFAVLVLGLAIRVLTLPAYTAAVVPALDVPRTAGLSRTDTLELAERVRAFVAGSGAVYLPPSGGEVLPRTWRGWPGFDSKAIGHLTDVRSVIGDSRVATLLSAVALAAWLLGVLAFKRRRALSAGMRAGAWAILAVVALAGLAAIGDFETFFSAFHGLFFASGTWQFAYDALLIRLFPERFWGTAAAVWALLALSGAGGLLVGARLVRPRPNYPSEQGA